MNKGKKPEMSSVAATSGEKRKERFIQQTSITTRDIEASITNTSRMGEMVSLSWEVPMIGR